MRRCAARHHPKAFWSMSALTLSALLASADGHGGGLESDLDEGSLLRTDRYTLLSADARAAPDPLDALITISFGEGIVTVGDAVRELLRDSGYRLRYRSARNCVALHQLLLSIELPASLRQLGPMPLRQALQSVVGRAWRLHHTQLGRFLSFEVAERYSAEIEAALGSAWDGVAGGRANEALRVFVPFGIAEFHAPKAEAAQAITRAAQVEGEALHWRLLGHSHSRATWATRAQARRRAEAVRRALIEAGVPPSRISIRTRASNRNSADIALRHGVEIAVVAGVAEADLVIHDDEICRRWGPRDGEGERAATAALNFSVQKGSLRRNIERLLRHFGLRMGHWGLSDGEYEYDWEVRHAYAIPAYNPDEALMALLGSYGIQPTLNLRDNSVDFSLLHSPRPGTIK